MSPITIVCDFSLGLKNQPIYYCDSELQLVRMLDEVPFDKLPVELIKTCMENNTDNLHLYGATEILTGLAEEIKALAATTYSNHLLNIEIN